MGYSMYPREFFELQLDFARHLVGKHGLELETALFNNTALYTRIIGHSDSVAPQKDNPVWQKLIAEMPAGIVELADHFYEAYMQAEKLKQSQAENKKSLKPCFHVYYHPGLNAYELHLDVNDELGVLSKNRIEARLAELKHIAMDMKRETLARGASHESVNLFVKTWLLNIGAFTRLFPSEFSNNAINLQNGGKSQDNAHWGQFLTRDKQLRAEVVGKFRHKMDLQEHTDFNLYFPYPAKYAQITLQELTDVFDLG